VNLQRDGEAQLLIEWSDGRRTVHTWEHLRANCPCATCREERNVPPDPFRIINPAQMTGPLRPVAMTPVGRYAYKITWNDGHDTGIYSFDTLRQLDESEKR
jgi:DUF971 family protein